MRMRSRGFPTGKLFNALFGCAAQTYSLLCLYIDDEDEEINEAFFMNYDLNSAKIIGVFSQASNFSMSNFPMIV